MAAVLGELLNEFLNGVGLDEPATIELSLVVITPRINVLGVRPTDHRKRISTAQLAAAHKL